MPLSGIIFFMSCRKFNFADNEIYHIYNRGVDKRVVFRNKTDLARFVQCILEFNLVDSVGGISRSSLLKNQQLRGKASQLKKGERLVTILNFCLNPNHYHLTLRQETERGVEKFMQRLGTGYTMYFNHETTRSGSLFQGKFKARHVENNEYLLHLSSYVNLNDRVHNYPLRGKASQWKSWSSLSEYVGGEPGDCQKRFGKICDPGFILEQFDGPKDYRRFINESLKLSREKKLEKKEREALWLE